MIPSTSVFWVSFLYSAYDGSWTYESDKTLILPQTSLLQWHTNTQEFKRPLKLTKVHQVKAVIFSSSHVWMWELDYKESWALNNWCFLTGDAGEDSSESFVLQGEQTVYPKRNQSWIFIERTDSEAETPILWPSVAKNWHWKRPWC